MALSEDCKGCELEDFCKLLYLDVVDGFVYCPDGTKHKVGVGET